MRLFGTFWLVAVFCVLQTFVVAQCQAHRQCHRCQGQLSKQAIQLLKSNAEALSARLALIESAKHHIEISTYHVESGKSATAILDALRLAAIRGVHVRLLFDGLNMGLSSCEVKSLQDVGIAVREFHPRDSGGLLQLNRRLHSKLFGVDGEFLILGSRNLRDKHFGLESDKYVDFEIVLQGDVAVNASHYFDWIWNSCHTGIAKGKQTIASRREGECSIACPAIYPAICSVDPFKFEPQFDVLACCLHDGTIDKSDKRMQAQRIAWVKSARTSLTIETPYPAFSRASLQAIEAAARRGVRVQLFTNSCSSNDQPLTWAALQNVRRRLLKLGVEIYEYRGEDTMHAKMFLVDGQFAVFGSHNFDARSDNFNLEFCVKVASLQLTAHLTSRLECRRLQSHRVTHANPTHNLPLTERAKTRLRQITALLIRPLL